MGPAYLFALIVGFGILLVQALMGSKDGGGDGDAHGELGADADAHAEFGADADAHAEFGADADADAHAEFGADGDADADADAHGELNADGADAHGDLHPDVGAGHKDLSHHAAGGHDKDLGAVGGLAALLLSTRFWIFSFLGFGLSGTLLHYLFGSVSAVATFATALIAGLASGFAAALAFRALRKTSSKTATETATAVGKVARVLVPCSSNGTGQVRILLDGQTVDLPAKTSELRIERGEYVLIEEVDGDVAQVSKAPPELRQ